MAHTTTTSRFCVLIAFICFLAGFVWTTEPWNWNWAIDGSQPSDESLKNSFRSKRSQFQKLVAMISEEKNVSRVSFDKDVLVSSQLSHQRYQEYLQLLHQAGVKDVIKKGEGHVEFSVWSENRDRDGQHQIYYLFCPRDQGSRTTKDVAESYETVYDDIKIETNWLIKHVYVYPIKETALFEDYNNAQRANRAYPKWFTF